MKEEIGKRIQEIRLGTNLPQNQFAKILKVSPQYLSGVENGKYGLSVEKIIALSKKTGISTDYILMGNKKDISDKISVILANYNVKQIKALEEILHNINILANIENQTVN